MVGQMEEAFHVNVTQNTVLTGLDEEKKEHILSCHSTELAILHLDTPKCIHGIFLLDSRGVISCLYHSEGLCSGCARPRSG